VSWIELIPDTEFNEPSAWNIVGTGGSVTGGQLVFTLANVIAATPVPSLQPVIGDEYDYRIDIDSVSAFGLTARAHFGGVDIWEKADGAGIFTGQIIAVATSGLIFQALPAMYAVNSVSVKDFMSSIASDAFQAILTRLEAILTAGGYNTNAGNQVNAGIRYFQDDSVFPIITVFSGPEFIEKLTFNSYRCERTVNVEGYVQDKATPTVSIEQLIEDVQRAIEQADITLGGIVEVVDYTGIDDIDPPDAGSDVAGVRITYTFSYQRVYGA